MAKKCAPCGSWLPAPHVAHASYRLGDLQLFQDKAYWTEIRPSEKGRSTVMMWDGKRIDELLTPPYQARSRVHEYGGGAFSVSERALFFCHGDDQQLYALLPSGKCENITRHMARRYAQPLFDPSRGILYAVEEDHRGGHGQVVNRIVKIDLTTPGATETVAEGCDFYSSLTLSPDKTQLAFLTWNHPHMPWDSSELWEATLSPNGNIATKRLCAGGPNESVFQPSWSPAGLLYFISDRTGWWNLYRKQQNNVEPCFPSETEWGEPQWIFGLSRYAFLSETHIGAFYTDQGIDYLALIDPDKKSCTTLALPFTHYSHLCATRNALFFFAASPQEGQALWRYGCDDQKLTPIRQNPSARLDPGDLSLPTTLSFPTADKSTAFGFYYPPANKHFSPLKGEKPPLIVKSHSGPSTRATATWQSTIQFWTNRGFAFLDVNYGGSTGYGRVYRERLKGKWGEVDVKDCVYGASYLAEKGLVDPKRLVIRGSSAGGYTALAALAFHSLFAAGASYYGVSDLTALMRETHKFEAHYLDQLIAPYPAHKQLYHSRSPLTHSDRITAPIIFFQGSCDEVVPPSQSEALFQALKMRKVPTAYLLFDGEGHGFRRSETMKRALEAELYFYTHLFHIPLQEPLEPVAIFST